MSTIILLIGILILAVLNIFVYRRINRNAEVYARWYLQDFFHLSWTVDKLVNENKMSKSDAEIQKNKYLDRNVNKNLLISKYTDLFAWILMALATLIIITFSLLKHYLFFTKVFIYFEIAIAILIYFEIAIAILILVAYISTVLTLHRLELKEVKGNNKKNRKSETTEQIDFYPICVDELMIELGLGLVDNKDNLNKIIETISLIRKEVPELPKVRISDNLSLGKFDYKLNCKGEEIITRTFSNDLTEENIEQIKTDIVKVYNEKLKNNKQSIT